VPDASAGILYPVTLETTDLPKWLEIGTDDQQGAQIGYGVALPPTTVTERDGLAGQAITGSRA